MLFGIFVTTRVSTIESAWKFLIECGAGLGLVLMLRWYWWRINVWSEISATIAPFVAYGASHFLFKKEFPESFFITVGFTTIVWIVVTIITKPEPIEHLRRFYDKVQPDGFWKPVSTSVNHSGLFINILAWFAAVCMVYAIMFGIGKLIFGEWTTFFFLVFIAVVSASVLNYLMARMLTKSIK
jgi:SSS family solute:Na+ symporter